MNVPKTARLTHVDIPMNPDAEEAYVQAMQALNAAAETLLETYPDRVKQAMLLAGLDPLDVEGRKTVAETVLAEDEANLTKYQDEAEAALEHLRATTVRYKFRSLGRKRYRELHAAHPPREEDHEAVRRETGDPEARAHFCDETFTRELLHLSAVSPALSVADVDEIFDGTEWNSTEIALLRLAAITAQSQGPRS